MPKNEFKVFDEAKANMLSQAAYETDAQRTGGLQSGVARSELHNKILYQLSVMAAALGDVLVSKGYDASDADHIVLATALQAVLVGDEGLLTDDVTGAHYRLGMESGNLYIVEVEE